MPRIYQKRSYQETFHSSSFEILEALRSRRRAYSRSHKSRTHSTRLWDREIYMLCIRDCKVNIFTFLSIRYVQTLGCLKNTRSLQTLDFVVKPVWKESPLWTKNVMAFNFQYSISRLCSEIFFFFQMTKIILDNNESKLEEINSSINSQIISYILLFNLLGIIFE